MEKVNHFSKLQGAGNDFIIMNTFEQEIFNVEDIAKKICNRNFGVGADGLMLVTKSDKADVKMLYYNSDGSHAEMCGNGIRCFAKYVFDKQIVQKQFFTIETLVGIKEISLKNLSDKEALVKVDMGNWDFNPKNIPVISDEEQFILQKVNIVEKEIEISCVRMGVPHSVVFVEKINKHNTAILGSEIETLKIFPEKINVNFVQVIDKFSILVDTWERGAGRTLACGTGACASVIISNHLGLTNKTVDVAVAGGNLNISITEKNRVMMEGKAEWICDGVFYL